MQAHKSRARDFYVIKQDESVSAAAEILNLLYKNNFYLANKTTGGQEFNAYTIMICRIEN